MPNFCGAKGITGVLCPLGKRSTPPSLVPSPPESFPLRQLGWVLYVTSPKPYEHSALKGQDLSSPRDLPSH